MRDYDAHLKAQYGPDLDGECACPPCPGRGNDGHGMTHCAECCFGSRVVADIDCPIHGETEPVDQADYDRDVIDLRDDWEASQ